MEEKELLERYEPVLRFAKSERFFPMAVEPYLERCSIFPSGPQGAVESLARINIPMAHRLGRLKSEQFYLRFVNKPLNDSDAWTWLAVLTVLGLAAGWSIAGVAGIEIVVVAALSAAAILFMLASPVRLRIIPAAMAAIIFIVLELGPIWFFLRPSEYVSLQVEYLVLLPAYLAALFYFSIRTMKFILDRIIPEFPGMIMDVLSQATEKIAHEAYREYSQILGENDQPVYYGRVLNETDEAGNHWCILQYHYFYAFNDWRLAAHGINHHEGDWEMVAVYLKNDAPHLILFSQHGAGNLERWEDVGKALDADGRETLHPIVYVALGSHANYSRPQTIRSPGMYKPGRVQRLLFWIDGLIHYLFLLFNPNQKARQIALHELQVHKAHVLAQDALLDMRDETDHYVVSLPMEIATGDGFRIGYQGDVSVEGIVRSTSYLRRSISDRAVTLPGQNSWHCVLLNPEPDWVQYKGLWGVKSILKEESGPPGPKWDRPVRNENGVRKRKRWGRPLAWLADLRNESKKN